MGTSWKHFKRQMHDFVYIYSKKCAQSRSNIVAIGGLITLLSFHFLYIC